MSLPRIALCALAACTTVENAPAVDPATTLDETMFRCAVQPVLVRQCSYGACHGQAGTALRVYSPGKLRATTPATLDEAIAALTDDEQHANFRSAAAFAATAPAAADNSLLRKPLAAAAGGYEHLGGAVFAGTDDASYVAIHDWLTGTGRCP